MHHRAIPRFEGFGLGLRPPHYAEFLETAVDVDFVEVISGNFMVRGGRPLYVLDAVRERHPVAMHGVSMSIGSADGVKTDYLRRLKVLADRVDPLWLEVIGDFTVRGNIHTVISVRKGPAGYVAPGRPGVKG